MFQRTCSQGWQENNGWKQNNIRSDLNCFKVENVSIIMGKLMSRWCFLSWPARLSRIEEGYSLKQPHAQLLLCGVGGCAWACPLDPAGAPTRNSSTGLFIVVDPDPKGRECFRAASLALIPGSPSPLVHSI